jgi:hypothetical protein
MTDWNKLKVVDLKAELKRRGLAQTGLKPQLVARLTAAENEEGAEDEGSTQGEVPKPDLSSATPAENVKLAPEAYSNNQTPESANQALKPQDVSTPAGAAEELTALSEPSKPLSQADEHTSPLPTVEPQEAIEDRQKRKRRSLTPPLSANEVAHKRFRTGGDGELSEEDTATSKDAAVEKRNGVNDDEVNAAPPDVASASKHKEDATTEDRADVQHPTSGFEVESPMRRRDSRFRGLFEGGPQPTSSMEEPTSRDTAYDGKDGSVHVVEPAIHPATPALYIRDFMRPLNQLQLKSHLAALATPANRNADEELVVNFYIDIIRTHAFVSFKSVSAAVRVRSALHGSVWPAERNRKPLWVDFIPAEKVEDWINHEKASHASGRSVTKKWEVVYHNINGDGPIQATLEEASDRPTARPVAPRQPSIPGPTGTSDALPARAFEKHQPEPRAATHKAPNPESRASNSFSTLDQLFNSTMAKPVLYWQPVSRSLAERRLDAIDYATSNDASRGSGGEINRYTFEDGDVLVDRGPEIFSGIRPPPSYRGPAHGGGSRGGFPSRGGRSITYDNYRRDIGPRDDVRWDRRGSRDDRYHY